MNKEEKASFNVLRDFYTKFIEPLDIHGDLGIFEDTADMLGQKDPLSSIDKQNYLEKNRGYQSACNIGLVHLCQGNQVCVRVMRKVKAAELQPCRIQREGDLVTAIYIPSYLSMFVYSIETDEHSFNLVHYNEESNQPIEDLLRYERSENSKLSSANGDISKELHQERTRDTKTKWMLTASDSIEMGGESYTRVRLTEPFFPIIAATLSATSITVFQSCSLLIEYALLDTAPRRAIASQNIPKVRDCIEDIRLATATPIDFANENIIRVPLPFKTIGSFAGGNRSWIMDNGRVYDITKTRDDPSTTLDERYNRLLVQMQ